MDVLAPSIPIVFIIDDDEDIRDGLKDLVESVGLRAITFASTVEFVHHKLEDVPSCLVLDIRMPGASGLDFQAELTARQVDIPIIFVTGHGDISMSVKAMKTGAIEFLTKPARDQDVLDAVRLAIDGDKAGRAQERRRRDVRVRYNTLSSREKEIMALVTVGFMNKQIAAAIGLCEVTVKVHRHKLMKKLGAQSLPDLVRIADMLKISQIKPAGCGAKGRQAVVASVARGAAGGVQFPMTSALGDTRKSSERAKPVAE